jgi:outer membrane lipoprotein-sorting protein
MAAVLSACAAVRPPAPPPPRPAGAQVDAIVQAMQARDRTLTTLDSAAVMEYRTASEHVKAREQIAVMRPARLRVEASSPFGVALIVAVDGARLQIYEPGKNLLAHGTANAATLDRFAQIPMEPRAAVDLLMAMAPDPEALAAHGDAAPGADGTLVIGYPAPDGGHREAAFSGGELAAVRERDAGGRLLYEVRYADYHNIGALMFPYSIDAEFPAAGSSLKLTFKRPIVNAALPASLFTLTPSATTKEIDLDQPPSADAAPPQS